MPVHPGLRTLGLLLRNAVDSTRTDETLLLSGTGAPSGATYGGKTLSTGEACVAFRADATDYDRFCYVTLDGGTTWNPVPITGSGGMQISNNTGADFAAGDHVAISTWDATNAMPEAVLADADDNTLRATHVVTETIADGATGYADMEWFQSDIDTSGYSAADVPLYLSATATTTNTLTETRPTGGVQQGQRVAVVTTQHATTGGIYHFPGWAWVEKVAPPVAGAFNLTAATTMGLEAGGAISIGADATAAAVNIATGAAARAIAVGNPASASLALEAGVGPFTLLADTTVDIDAGTALGIESAGGAITIGGDAVAQALNLGTGAAARIISVGNPASASMALDAGVGGFTLLADTTIDLDCAGALSLNSTAAAINIGNDADDFALNLGTAGARVIALGSATAASLALDAGIGGFTLLADTTVDVQCAGVVTIDSSGAAITIGGDADAFPLNLGTSASARVISIGNAASASMSLDAGVGGFTLLADTTIDLDCAGALSLNSTGAAINVGDDADDFALNLGTAGARAITIGSATAASLALDAGVGGFTLLADTTADLQCAGVLTIDSSGAAITIGGDADAFPLNLGTSASARVISIGNAASASMALDAGVGGFTLLADTTVAATSGTAMDLTAGTDLTLQAGGDDVVAMAAAPNQLRGFNRLSDRFELKWVAGERGLPGINGDIQNAAEAVRMIADPNFEVVGQNAATAGTTYYAEGGILLTCAGAAADAQIVAPHLDADQSPWTQVVWAMDKEVIWECVLETTAGITDRVIHAGLKLTNTATAGVDNDEVFFRFEDSVAAGNWQAIHDVGGGAPVATDSGVTVAVSTKYHLMIIVQANRTALMYINGALVDTTAALTAAADLIPYIGVTDDGTGAAVDVRVYGQDISRIQG